MKRRSSVCFELLLALIGLLVLASGANAQDLVRIDRAEFVLADTALPPADDAAWQPVTLPDDWYDARPDVVGVGWYRMNFDIAQYPPPPQALYTPRVRTVGQVFVNGQLVGWSGVRDAVDARGLVPHLFELPGSVLKPGRNRVHVRVEALADWGRGLGRVTIGDDLSVRPIYERRWLLQVVGPQVSFVLTLLFGLFAALLWLRSREPVHLWFALSMLGFAVYTTTFVLPRDPLPAPFWLLFVDLCGYLKMFSLAFFALRFAALRWPRTERALVVLSALTVAAVVAMHLGAREHPAVILGVEVGWRIASAVCIAALGLAAWRTRDAEHILIALAALPHPLVSLYFVGLLPFVHGLPWRPDFESLQPSAYDSLPMLLVIAWSLVGRFIASLRATERMNAELEDRVATKQAELQANYERLRTMEQQQAVAAERARITSDMHDGIGGQLISTLNLVELGTTSNREVALALRECIDDLRLAIDSLQPVDDDVLPMLGNLRYRLEPRLKASGVSLDWQVSDLPKLACLTPANVLHLLRILQEAFTNVLKHARADRVAVQAGVEPDARRVFIRISDNGRGFDGGTRPEGHGLGNMLRRAKTIGGELRVQPSDRGTTLELLLPVA